MTTRKDPLNNPQSPDRVYYATGALLDKEDFLCEQLYHRGRLARVLAYLHGSGTVAGLFVPPISGEEETLTVSPGLAVDRLGRLIEVPRSACIRLSRWLQNQIEDPEGHARLMNSFRTGSEGEPDCVVADVFLKFEVCERGYQPAFASGNYDATDAVAPSRLRDGYRIDLVIREEDELPVPSSGFPDLSGLTDQEIRERVMQYKLEEAWKEGTAWTGPGETLIPMSEHISGQDGTEILLARLWVPVTVSPLSRDANFPIDIDNTLRRFAFSSSELAWLRGL